jgi:hypothetical protein
MKKRSIFLPFLLISLICFFSYSFSSFFIEFGLGGFYGKYIGSKATDFSLRGVTGKEVNLNDYRGDFLLLTFGFTKCTGVCPINLSRFKRITEILSSQDIEKVNFVFITFDDIDQTVIHATTIISGLRNISRDPSNEDFEACRIGDLVNDVLSVCSEKLKSFGVDLIIDIAYDLLDKEFLVMRVQLSQVLLNLLTNSYDEIAEKKDAWIKLTAEEKNEQIFFKVIDCGVGIPEDIQEKIFQPFLPLRKLVKGQVWG